MKNDMLARLLEGLKSADVEKGERNRAVAGKTGYSEKTVGNILSGNAPLTSRFIQAVCSAFWVRKAWIENGEEPITEFEEAFYGRRDLLDPDKYHPATGEPVLTQQARDMLLSGLDPATKEAVKELQMLPESERWIVVGELKKRREGKGNG